MITLTAKINILSSENSELTLASDNLSGNNISRNLNSIVGVKNNGKNPFILGASPLESAMLCDNVNYYIGNQLSNENGEFSAPYNIVLQGNNLKLITIAFDKTNNGHPNKILASFYNVKEFSYTYTTEQYKWEWSGEGEEKTGTIYFELPSGATIKSIAGHIISFSGSTRPRITITERGTNSFEYKITAPTNEAEGSCYYDFNIIYSIVSATTLKSEEYIDDDAIFTLQGDENANKVELIISDWNKPLYPLIITGIYIESSIEIDRKNLISISRSIFDRSDLKLPSFGIISNTGNVEFNDLDGEIRDYAEQLLLQSGLDCEIRLNNTLVDGASELVAKMETDQWDYDNDNRVVSVSIKDDLEEWQDINVPEIPYDPRKVESKPFSWLYEHLWGITNENYPMQKLVDLDDRTYNVLTTTYIQYPLLESGNLWQQWTKLCQACQLHIYKNSDGIVVCRYNGGN